MKDTVMKCTKNTGLTEKLELRIYRLLGIVPFKRLLLRIEKIKHRNKGTNNDNYHPSKLTPSSLIAFRGYLQYNALLHVVSIFFVVLYFVISSCAHISLWWLACLAWLVLVVDLYCIILQRYSYLRAKRVLARCSFVETQISERTVAQLQKRIMHFTLEELRDDLSFLNNLHLCSLSGETCIVSAGDTDTLKRLCIITENLEGFSDNTGARASTGSSTKPPKTFGTNLYSRTSLRVSRLQHVLKVNNSENVLFGFTVVTETATVESLYRAVFSTYSRDRMYRCIGRLISAYTHAIKEKG